MFITKTKTKPQTNFLRHKAIFNTKIDFTKYLNIFVSTYNIKNFNDSCLM